MACVRVTCTRVRRPFGSAVRNPRSREGHPSAAERAPDAASEWWYGLSPAAGRPWPPSVKPQVSALHPTPFGAQRRRSRPRGVMVRWEARPVRRRHPRLPPRPQDAPPVGIHKETAGAVDQGADLRGAAGAPAACLGVRAEGGERDIKEALGAVRGAEGCGGFWRRREQKGRLTDRGIC